MKRINAIITFLIMCFSLSAQSISCVEFFKAGNPIKFCGDNYYLAWSSHPTSDFYIQEYLPKDESLDNFSHMFTVCVRFDGVTAYESVSAKIDELESRKEKDPITNYLTLQNDKNEYILDFIVSDCETPDDENFSTVELNIYYYRNMTLNKRRALVLCFYSQRAYEDDIEVLIPSIPSHRVEWYTGMEKANIKPKFLK